MAPPRLPQWRRFACRDVAAWRPSRVILRAVAGSTSASRSVIPEVDPATPLRCAQDDGIGASRDALVWPRLPQWRRLACRDVAAWRPSRV